MGVWGDTAQHMAWMQAGTPGVAHAALHQHQQRDAATAPSPDTAGDLLSPLNSTPSPRAAASVSEREPLPLAAAIGDGGSGEKGPH